MNQAPSASPTPAPRRKSKKKWILIGGTVALIALIAIGVVSKRSKKTGIPVTTEKAFVKTITQVVTATGKVQPETEVKISPEVAGEITALPFKEGNGVKKGDLLLKIKPDFYEAQLEQQEASLVAAQAASVLSKARLNKAEQDYLQAKDLYAKKLISDADILNAKTNYEVAKADLDSSMAQIRRTEGSVTQASDQLSKTTIYAPMDGTISSLTSELGERVVGTGQFEGTEIMRVADLSNMEVRVKVNENDIVNVKLGDKGVISIDAFPGRKFTGTVKEISSSAQGTANSGANSQSAASASDEVANFLVKIRITDRDIMLRPGMSATADIETQTVENVVAVPIQSVTVRADGGKTSEELQQQKAKEAREKSGNDLEVADEKAEARRTRDLLQRVIFVRNGDKVKMQKVETGIADNTHIEVKSGVKAGDEVVSGSYAAISRRLKDGAEIEIEKPKKDSEKK
ncbi:MAG: efflux RND transporter periplasmic adaptor subunit [Opitutaceae bacterium]|nr:efflux RND transporter periplasmic adaptor subunit [Opitutaceae bacterium]MBP9913009.1 efflux RND transporter periplasmic adaptor subunit [Opitutaceae bacterium]